MSIEGARQIPVHVLRLALRVVPPVVLARTLDVLVAKMRVRRPAFFRHLERLPKGTLLIAPTDVAARFLLDIGTKRPTIQLLQEESDARTWSATLCAPLGTLVDMLEGRVDGDKLFFSRDISLDGNTEVVVALRNALDREDIQVYDDFLSLAGPFAGPLRTGIGSVDKFLNTMKGAS